MSAGGNAGHGWGARLAALAALAGGLLSPLGAYGVLRPCDRDPSLLAAALLLGLAGSAVAWRADRSLLTPKWIPIFARVGAALAAGSVIVLGLLTVVAGLRYGLFRESRRMRSSVEARNDVRTMISAQAAYHQAAGRYATIECLRQPATCGLPDDTPPFLLGEHWASRAARGYRRTLHVGAEGFSYLAVPVTRSSSDSCWSYCGDSSGRVCGRADGEPAALQPDGLCPAEPACADELL